MKFAFYSGSLTDAGDMLAKAREAVALGLSRDAAIRAFTMSPAEIFGVSDRLGSIEVGKIANLVMASGDIFDEGTRIEQVVVDGEPFEVPAPSDAVAMEAPEAGPVRARVAAEGAGTRRRRGAPTRSPCHRTRGPTETTR